MRVVVTGDAAAFRDAVFPVLRADPVRNSVLLTAVGMRADGFGSDPGPATYLRVLDEDGTVVGTAMRTPPMQVLLGEVPDELVGAVAEVLARDVPDAPGVQAVPAHALAFAERWRELTGREFEPGEKVRLHRLGELTMHTAAGAPGQAAADDLEMVTDWYQAFGDDVGQPMTRDHAERTARERMEAGRSWLWYDGGRAVCLVAHTRSAYGATRIGPVYTPAEHRGRGYASALTSHVSALIRQRGDQVCLYTDLANPTSNKIYAAIGYEPVVDFAVYHFR